MRDPKKGRGPPLARGGARVAISCTYLPDSDTGTCSEAPPNFKTSGHIRHYKCILNPGLLLQYYDFPGKLCHFEPPGATGATLGVRVPNQAQKMRVGYTYHLQLLSHFQ